MSEFWRGRGVFVTGHTGFVGGWLTLWLQRHGARVTGYSLAPPTQPNLFTLAKLADGVDSVIGDIRDLPRLRACVQQAQPEVVLHLAAQPLVRLGYAEPVETFHTNVLGTVHVLEAARAAPSVRAIVNVTTDKCYENREWPWGYRECDPLGGHDPYSNSKACSELVTASYRASFFDAAGVPVASARAGNIIGGGDWGVDRLIPDLVAAFEAHRPARIRRPDAVRPWQHVLEPVAGYLLLAERLLQGADVAGAWNFGPSEEARPVRDVAAAMAERWGEGARWIVDDAGRHPKETQVLRLDCAKARAVLGWKPRLSLDDALDWTVQWHRERRGGADVRGLCERQILAYEQRA